MPESEQSFSDRAQKGRDLHAAAAEFAPVYTPPPLGVTLAAFDAKILACEGLNNSVVTNSSAWSEAVGVRVTTAGTIKRTTTQLINFIKAGAAWKSKFATAKRLADAIRGIRLPRPPVAPPPPGGTAAQRRERGGQSFAELETNWRGLAVLTEGLAGFAPTDVRIQMGTLNGLLSGIKGLNGQIAGLEAALTEAQQDRVKAFYKEEEGLEFQFATVKTTVKGQYGADSTQWAQVKGMKW